MEGPPDLLTARAAHDDLSFDELRGSYNFENVSGRGRTLTRMVIDACQERRATGSVRAVDIGCGDGIERRPGYQWAIREHVDDYWGIEPDPSMTPDPRLFDTYLAADLEHADLPATCFDVAYSFMVMEHVADPGGFMHAVHRCLKPGGTYLFATPNGRHYFARTASLLHKLRLDEAVLRRTIGAQAADEYHYPVQYRFNSERKVRRIARKVGFNEPEFAYVEVTGPIDYFPRSLRFIYHALRAKRRLIRRPRSLIMMLCRITKPVGGAAPAPSGEALRPSARVR